MNAILRGMQCLPTPSHRATNGQGIVGGGEERVRLEREAGHLQIRRDDTDKALPSKSNIEETLNKCDQLLFIIIGTHQSFCLLLSLGKGFAHIHGTRTITSKTQEAGVGRGYSSAAEEPTDELRWGPPLSLLTLFSLPLSLAE